MLVIRSPLGPLSVIKKKLDAKLDVFRLMFMALGM